MRRFDFGFSLSAFLAAVAWGTVVAINKVGVAEFGPVFFAAVRAVAASPLLFILLFLTGGRLRLTRQEFLWLLLAGLGPLGVSALLLHLSLRYTAANHTAILASSAPIFTVLIALAARLEKPTIRLVTAILLAFAGVSMVMQWGAQGSLAGDLMAVGMAITWGAYNVIAVRLTRTCSPLQILSYITVFSAVLLVPASLPEMGNLDLGRVSFGGWFSLVYAIILGSVAGFVLWQLSIERIGASRTMTYYYLQPISGVLLASFLYGEQLMPLQILGAILVLVSVGLARR